MPAHTASLVPRQFFLSSVTSSSLPPACTPNILSSGGLVNIGQNAVITLTQDAVFQPDCPGTPVPQPVDPTQPGVDLSVLNYQEPFYSSTNPQIYAIAAVTVVSYMLVIILFITPRTFFVGGAGGGGGFLGQKGMISGGFGSNSVIGVGDRPWLQKAATLTVAISLTIVTADTFRWAELQYYAGYEDATELTLKVINGLEVRIVRVISETFLWLAQAQTLIRLFPRHKEKLVIKWTAFGLITLELIFSVINHFVEEDGKTHPKRFVNAIPALNYLFALALNLCYAAFVFYYALCKRRYAFVHPKMRNMPLVALLSLAAVLIPVIFFILDISKPNVSGWGSYVRWVGAAAASVVVWEWVERIEALERDEKKDGILGREIFDGDEMLDVSQSSGFSWGSGKKYGDGRMDDDSGGGGGGMGDVETKRRFGTSGRLPSSMSSGWNNLTARSKERSRSKRQDLESTRRKSSQGGPGQLTTGPAILRRVIPSSHFPQPPLPVASPISRATTGSAASTVYRVYHYYSQPTPPIPEATQEEEHGSQVHEISSPVDEASDEPATMSAAQPSGISRLLNPFKRQRDSPPLEVAQALSSDPVEATETYKMQGNTSLLQKLRLKKIPHEIPELGHVIVVPAPPRRFQSIDSDAEIEPHVDIDRQGGENGSASPALNRDSPPVAVVNAMQSSQSSVSTSGHAVLVKTNTSAQDRADEDV